MGTLEIKNLFLELESNLGLYHVVLISPKAPPKNSHSLFPKCNNYQSFKRLIRKTFLCPKWQIPKGRRKLWVNFKTETEKLRFFVFRYRIDLYLEDNESDLKLKSEWLKQLFKVKTNFVKNEYSLAKVQFSILTGLKTRFEHNSARKSFFLIACWCWDARFFSLIKNIYLEKPLVMATRTRSSYFVISKCLD